MKKLAIAFAVVALSYLGYKAVFAVSPAYNAYKAFADALLYLQYDEAERWTNSRSVRKVIQRHRARARAFGAYRWEQMNQIFIGPSRSIEREETSRDGKTVTLRVIQEVRRGPINIGPVGPMNFRATHDVVMVETSAGWKVESFEEKEEQISER